MTSAKSPGASSPEDLIAVGIIRKAHGVRGEVSVEPWTDFPDRFSELSSVFLVSPDRSEIVRTSVLSSRGHGERALVRFEVIASPEQVAGFRGWSIEIPATQARKLGEDEYFLHDLVGLSVIDDAGKDLGKVTSVYEGGGGFLLTVGEGSGAFDIPFAASICTSVDLAAQRMTVSLPAGLERLSEEENDEIQKKKQPAAAARLRVDLVSIFPRMFDSFLSEGIIAKAAKAGLLKVKVWDLREFASDSHRSTDDQAYGGGAGMVMLAEPVFRCLDAIRAEEPGKNPHVILTSPQGGAFHHHTARELAEREWLVILCGRYEGFDERIREGLAQEEISIGDFVVTGGELPAMLILDATARMIEGVVGDRDSVEADSFFDGLLDHPHYTRPAELRGMKVPEVLLSGHAEKIRAWRKEQALRATMLKRPDLLQAADLDPEGQNMLARIRSEQAPGPGLEKQSLNKNQK